MRKPIILPALFSLPLLSGCFENNTAECQALFNDESKRPLARPYCEKAAKEGNAIAQRVLSQLYLAQQQPKQAVSWLEKSANQRDPQALFTLGQWYESGNIFEQDPQKAHYYYQQSCQAGEIKACERVHSLEQAKLEQQAQAEQVSQIAQERQALEQQKAQLEAERKQREKQLAEEKRLLEERKAFEAEKARLQAETQERYQPRSMSMEELRQTYSDFSAEIERDGNLMSWVSNCYAVSNDKLGCFHFDYLTHLVDEMVAKEGNTPSPFFTLDRVKARAKSVPEFQKLSTLQFEQTLNETKSSLMAHSYLYEEMKKVREQRLAKKSQDSTASNSTFSYYDGLAKFQQNGLWGFVDRNGNVAIQPQFKYAGRFSRERAAVQSATSELWGFIDTRGHYIVYPQYCSLAAFSESDGLAGVYKNGYKQGDECVGGKWGYIDTSGRFVVDALFDKAERFVNGKAKVTYQGRTGYINRNTQWVE